MGLGVKSAYATPTKWDNSSVGYEVVDGGTKLVISPMNGTEGTMPEVNYIQRDQQPWAGSNSTITTVEFKGTIHAGQRLKGLFWDMFVVKTIDFGSFDTSNVTDMSNMFFNCNALQTLNLSNFDSSSVKDMSNMFFNCINLQTLDLSSFDTSKVMSMRGIFSFCGSLTTIYVSNAWDATQVTDADTMFYGCTSLQGGAGTTYSIFRIDATYAHIDGVGGLGYLTRGYEVIAPSVASLTYGDTPSFQGGSATFGQGTTYSPKVTVAGTWSLDPRASKPQAGDTRLSVVFTPNNAIYKKYLANYITINIPEVAKRAVTVTPDTASKDYGAADPTFTYQANNLAYSDTKKEIFTGSLSRESGTLPGLYDIQVGTLNLKADGKAKNYSFNKTTGFTSGVKFTINPKERIPVPKDANAVSLTYNGLSQSPTKENIDFSDYTPQTNVDENGYTATATPKPGYIWSDTGVDFDYSQKSVKWFITKKDITITANNRQSEVGKPEEELTYRVDGLEGQDREEEVLTGSLVRDQKETTTPGSYDILQGTLTTGGTKGANYLIATFNKGTYKITSQGTVAEPSTIPRTYNGEAQDAFEGIDTNKFIITDNIQTNANAAGEHYTARVTPAVGFTWEDGTRDEKTVEWTISQLPITVVVTARESIFNQSLESLDYTTSPTLPTTDSQSDVFTGSLACSVAPTSNPGVYQITQGDLDLNTEGKGNNYILLGVTESSYTLSALAEIEVPKAEENLTYDGTEQTGVKPVDNVILTDNTATNAGNDYKATATLEAGYIWKDTEVPFDRGSKTISFSIGKRNITVTADKKESVYGDKEVSLTYSVDTLAQTDTKEDVFTGGLKRSNPESKSVDTYIIDSDDLTLGGVKGSNYVIREFIPSTYEITKRPVSVTIKSETIYVGEKPSFSYTLSDENYRSDIDGELFINEDTNTAGEYKIQTSKLTSHNLDLTFSNTASLTVNAKPVFPGGGGSTPGPVNPNNPDNPNNPNNPDDPNGSNPPAAPTDPDVPIKGDPGWVNKNGNWYYYNLSGILISGWISDYYHWYYLSPEGIMYTGWNYIDNTWYYFNDAGQMQTGWVYVDDTWYYLNTSGAMQTGWFSDTYNWYYLDNSGAMQTGWIYTDDTWYLTDTSGAMKTGWEYVGGAWYHLDQTGAMTTGWYSDGYNWYYLNTSGAMATGTQSIDGVTYTFDSNGAWVA